MCTAEDTVKPPRYGSALSFDLPGKERQMPTRTRWFGLAAASMLAAVPCQAADGSITAIVGATVIHPDRDLPSAVASRSTVIVAGRRIESIGPAGSTPVPAGATLIAGRGKWVVPGLIDSHIHFFQSGNLYTRPDVADFNKWMPYAKEVARNKARLPATFKVWLASGVTGVVDIGGPFWNFDVRDAALKSPAAPRVAVAGPLISMVDRVKLDLGDPPIIKAASADEARALVRRELERKPDFIKVWFIHRQGDDLAAQQAIVKAAADAAHAARSEEHTSELQSRGHLVCRLLLRRQPRSTLFPYTTLFRSSRSGSSTGRATISPRSRRSSKRLPTRHTRPECALPCTRPSSSWPRPRSEPARIFWCTRWRTRRWTRNSLHWRKGTARSIARRSSSPWVTAMRCRIPGGRPKPSGAWPIRRSSRR